VSLEPELATERDIYLAVDLENNDRSAEAVEVLRKARKAAPREAMATLDSLLLSAEAGAAFDRKDYDDFLAKAKAVRGARQDEVSVAMVASALACKYAATGEETYKTEAMATLREAERLAGDRREQFSEYQERILYRLKTREILTKKEYDRKVHPSGGSASAAANAPSSASASHQEGGR
jgi:hypothetical protein